MKAADENNRENTDQQTRTATRQEVAEATGSRTKENVEFWAFG